ncbi:MAG: hypothetical protein JOZ62_01145 [Acidobacteriaceae bacterium]|nr:hypothetical protein [Acidobacteriaceae bacterium]
MRSDTEARRARNAHDGTVCWLHRHEFKEFEQLKNEAGIYRQLPSLDCQHLAALFGAVRVYANHFDPDTHG